jgi:hypothetical protein
MHRAKVHYASAFGTKIDGTMFIVDHSPRRFPIVVIKVPNRPVAVLSWP